jgi:aspartyl-tRNA synthetase
MRHRLTQAVRASLCEQGFLEIETPMLAKSTPEGARDFLVPSRLQPGSFYALPQSPQIMKQLLMISGFDRYFQIARCFRDEDQRADRQLEFTQVDLELAFTTGEEVLLVLEAVTVAGCAAGGIEVSRPFARIAYAEAMAKYGIDRPDTRIQLELVDLTDAFAESGFNAFRKVVDGGGIVKCLPIHDAQELSRGQIDKLESFVRKELGAKGRGSSSPPAAQPATVTASSTSSTSSTEAQAISRSTWVNSSWRSARWSSSRKQRAIWK